MSVVDNTVVGQGGAVGHLTSGSQLSLRARLAEVCRTVKQQQDTQNRNHQSRRRRRRESIVWRSSARATTTTTTTVGHSSAESRRLGGGSAAARRRLGAPDADVSSLRRPGYRWRVLSIGPDEAAGSIYQPRVRLAIDPPLKGSSFPSA